MDTLWSYISAAGLAALCVLVLILLVMVLRLLKRDPAGELEHLSRSLADTERRMQDTFSRERTERAAEGKALREDTQKGLSEVSARLEAMTKANYEQRIGLTEAVTAALGTIRDKNAEQNERQSKALDAALLRMQESNEKKLDEMRVTVDEKLTSTLTTRLDSSFKTVSGQLENLYKSLGEMKELSAGVTTNVTTLNRVLTNVKARGTWAEVQLEGLLDQTIPGMYLKNAATGVKETERVEFAVKIPSGDNSEEITLLPVDSKFPMEDYIRLCDAADSADAELLLKARKALEDRVLKEARDITKYINVPKTTPFAIMYLATEGLYAEIAASKNGVAERIQNEFNIMIAGPTTITALLNSLAMGFKTVAINQKANEVRKLLAAAKSQYETFGDLLLKARKKIDEAGKTLDTAQHRSSIIQKKLKNVEALDADEAQTVLGLEAAIEDED